MEYQLTPPPSREDENVPWLRTGSNTTFVECVDANSHLRSDLWGATGRVEPGSNAVRGAVARGGDHRAGAGVVAGVTCQVENAPADRVGPGRVAASGAAISSRDLRSAATPRKAATSPPAIITSAASR